jgi:hypothetical protein
MGVPSQGVLKKPESAGSALRNIRMISNWIQMYLIGSKTASKEKPCAQNLIQ